MLNRLKTYTVHIKPGSDAYRQPVFLREGFNIYAFLFTFLWAFSKRLWLQAFGLLFIQAALVSGQVEGTVLPQSASILLFAIQVIFGFHANDWLRAKLTRKGYVMADITTGETLARAELRYFDRHYPTRAVRAYA